MWISKQDDFHNLIVEQQIDNILRKQHMIMKTLFFVAIILADPV